MTDLIFHVNLQDHRIKRPFNFVERKLLSVYFYLPKFGGHRHCSSGYMVLVSNVASQHHMIICSCDFVSKRLKSSFHPTKFCSHRHHCGRYIMALFVTWSHKSMWSKGNVVLWAGLYHDKLHSCKVWWS